LQVICSKVKTRYRNRNLSKIQVEVEEIFYYVRLSCWNGEIVGARFMHARSLSACVGMDCVTIFVGRSGKGGGGLRAYARGVKVCGKSIAIRGSVRPMRSLVITRAR